MHFIEKKKINKGMHTLIKNKYINKREIEIK